MNSQRIFLLTNRPPNIDGGGMIQTLYNLFEGSVFEVIVLAEEGIDLPSSKSFLAAPTYVKLEKFKALKFRGSSGLNKLIERINFRLRDNYVTGTNKLPLGENDVLLICTTNPRYLHFGYILWKTYNPQLITYWMDDWMGTETRRYAGVNLSKIEGELLYSSSKRIMISRQLDEMLRKRHNLPAKPTLIIHNPATVFAQKAVSVNSNNIIYAGSLWPMHADAFFYFLNILQVLNEKHNMNFRVILYTPEVFFRKYKEKLKDLPVKYGGYLKFSDVHEKLQNALANLCSASFLPEYESYSLGSLQTKLTDYLSSGRPIVYCGPGRGASGVFVNENNAGLVLDGLGKQDPSTVKKNVHALGDFLLDKKMLDTTGEHNLQNAKRNFNAALFKKVFNDFLKVNNIKY